VLPYYCTPALVLALDELPITSRGKIDKRALTILAVARLETAAPQAAGAAVAVV
jgi:D-alanine--poly(phosphoribitol) ligase subunit 1